jgi:hypothetical protein
MLVSPFILLNSPLPRIGLSGKVEYEGAAFTRLTGYPQLASVSLYYLFGNGQAQTQAWKTLAVLLDPVVRFKEPFLIFESYPDALVLHFHYHAFFAGSGS